MRQPVRFDELGPSGMARRFGDERLEVARAALSDVEGRQGVAPVPPEAHCDIEWSEPAKEVTPLPTQQPYLSEAPADAAARSGPKVGRPTKHPGKPWEAEGISRALWYRRKAAEEDAK
jgi:hypothetical protein